MVKTRVSLLRVVKYGVVIRLHQSNAQNEFEKITTEKK